MKTKLKSFFMNLIKLIDEFFNSYENATLIVAMDYKTRGIGFEGHIPWKVKEDMAFFKEITTKNKLECRNIIVCGKNTFDSFRKGGVNSTLNNRHTVVITKSLFVDKHGRPTDTDIEKVKGKMYPFEVLYFANNEHIKMVFCMNPMNGTFIAFISNPNDVLLAKRHIVKYTGEFESKLFIIGGGKIYDEFLKGVKDIRITEAFVTCLRFNEKISNITPARNEHCDTCDAEICDNSKINFRFNRFDTFFNFAKIKENMKLVSFMELGSGKISNNVKPIRTNREHIVMRFKSISFIERLFKI